ncbi:MAG: hypothetical protein NC299_09795 [Lachnospiraceae bacterium]|nr:hypothetical protein [Ruminococcus sp.]MCM1275646.1 hypothetical protein [Lachnospiraceae bacterium]
MFSKTDIVPKRTGEMTFYEAAFATIKSDLCDIANAYLCIAFRVYEIDCRIRKDGKKCKYKTIAEACELELGFKKSTTYNMLNIVKTYGIDPKTGMPSYNQLCSYSQYSYSQLVEMLSLGFEQRAAVTPETPVAAIRMLKKPNEKEKPEVFQTSGKSSESVEKTETFQTSGKISFSGRKYEINVICEESNVAVSFDDLFVDLVDDISNTFNDFWDDLSPRSDEHLFLSDYFDHYLPDELEEKFNEFMTVYERAYSEYIKQRDITKKSAV